MTNGQAICEFLWGSHGCHLAAGHAGSVHRCGEADPDGPCCEYDESADSGHRVRHFNDGWGDWGPYGDGWRQSESVETDALARGYGVEDGETK